MLLNTISQLAGESPLQSRTIKQTPAANYCRKYAALQSGSAVRNTLLQQIKRAP